VHLLLVLPLSARRMMKINGVSGIHSASAVPTTRSTAPVTVARMAPNSTPAAISTFTRPAKRLLKMRRRNEGRQLRMAAPALDWCLLPSAPYHACDFTLAV